ncbi:hypothetical protein GCM10023224_15870 [Streptomonospora halophila]|uniref:ATP/GTP-binding protein n=1 Tax=Streptomonospora halophila TaxID=427369 RepID=A0ABP9GE61_9ACTN
MLRRRVVLVLLTVSGVTVVPIPSAWADGPEFLGRAECGTHGGPGCNVSAESGQDAPGSAAQGGDNSGGGAEPESGGSSQAAAEPNCEQVAPGEQECETTLTEEDLGAEDVIVSAVAVAEDARDAMELPQPEIATSPAAEQPVLVQVPVWLWIDEDTWRPETARAEVPGGAVSVTATPDQARWSMGDDTTLTCDGPGVPYVAGRHDPAAASPECGHTYTRASTAQPGEVYDLGVEVAWEVTWESSEGGGELDPLVTTAAAEVEVVESHGLVEPTR